MKITRAQMFVAHPSARRVLDEIISYISASFTNPALWQLIQDLARDEINRHSERRALKKREGQQEEDIRDRVLPYEIASPERFFSIDFFLKLSAKLYHVRGGDDNGGSLHSIGEAFELLLEGAILDMPYAIFHRDTHRGQLPELKNQHYTLNKNFADYLIKNGLIYNHLFGFNYIIDRYTTSVVKIEVRQGDDIALGTGWIFDLPFPSHSQKPIRLVVTNDHVLANSSSIKVLDKFDRIIPHHKTALLLDKMGVDIALLLVDYNEATPAFLMHSTVPLLEEVITIGYPTVPLAREAYQLVHRGEVNASVTDYHSQELLIISARTAPGNSGSPVIDDTGRVVGMIAQQLFEKAAFEQKGITPYSACIPAFIIQQAIHETLPLWLIDRV
jgi:S1-C subfamily serine protease